jgi:hypothetical protein
MTHTCHWPGCNVEVPPAMWGCKSHWFKLPKPLRNRIWATYVPGQEITKTPDRSYLDAAKAVQEWIAGQIVFDGRSSEVTSDPFAGMPGTK